MVFFTSLHLSLLLFHCAEGGLLTISGLGRGGRGADGEEILEVVRRAPLAQPGLMWGWDSDLAYAQESLHVSLIGWSSSHHGGAVRSVRYSTCE